MREQSLWGRGAQNRYKLRGTRSCESDRMAVRCQEQSLFIKCLYIKYNMKVVMEKSQGDEGTEQIKGTERIQGVRIQSL